MRDNWKLFEHQEQKFCYLSQNKIVRSFHKFRGKLSPEQINLIRNIDIKEYGAQRRLAKKLGFDETYISRVRRKLKKTTDLPELKNLTDVEKRKLSVYDSAVEQFFENKLSIKKFLEIYPKKKKNIYKMCAQTGGYRKPKGWEAVRVSGIWLLYREEESEK